MDSTLKHRKTGRPDASNSLQLPDAVSEVDVSETDHTGLPTGLTVSKTEAKTPDSADNHGVCDHPARKLKKPLINVAPLNTPLYRRLETFAVVWHTISIPFFFCVVFFVLYLGLAAWVGIVLPYCIWWYGFDLHTPTNGKVVYRVRDWMRNLIIWEWFVNYYPIRLHKSCDLEPTFTTVLVEQERTPDDEDDLVSEDARTMVDKLFKFLGLSKRLNDLDSSLPPPDHDMDDQSSNRSAKLRYRRVSGGPRYIFGYHPHGVISMGAMGLFATNSVRNEPFAPPLRFLKPLFHDPSKGERMFPGIGYVFPLTLTTQFTVPVFRDYLLSLGLTSASARNIKSIINNGDNSVCVVVGGARESLLNDMVGGQTSVGIGYKGHYESEEEPAEKKQIKLVLKHRKGFVKLAIEVGNVLLVPTFAFGEADVYKLATPKPGSFGYSFQQWMNKTFHFTLPFFSARGVFIYDFGFLPYRTPINICTGRPIYVPPGLLNETNELKPAKETRRLTSLTNLLNLGKKKTPARTKIPQEILDHYHLLYVEELRRVYEENKHKFGYGDVELSIIE